MIHAPRTLLFHVILATVGCASDPMARALTERGEGAFQVWVFTAPEPAGPWTAAERPLASGVSSLGLHEEEGRLALTGLPMEAPPWWEEAFPRLRVRGWRATPGLGRARAADPGAWEPARWPVDDPQVVAAIDPQGFEGALWYFAAEGRGGDPARGPGAHRLRSSPPATARLSGAGLADPSPVRFRGETLLFATAHPDAVILAAGEPLAERARFSGVSVPFARVVPGPDGVERLWLLAQAAVGGRRQPVLSVSEDGQSWSAWTTLLELGPRRSCTSPVLGRLADGWLLACVEEPGP